MTSAVRRLLVESPRSLGAQARERRWQLLRELFGDLSDLRVVDLGGTLDSWRRAPLRPAHVTVVNLLEPGETTGPEEDAWLQPVMGDACAARAALAAEGLPGRYDLVFSNSLIEHVGGHAKRQELADEVHALAPRHWVQTPNRYFPVEPHWLFPMMQFLPARARFTVARRWPLAHTLPETAEQARSEAMWVELLGPAEMRAYFPDSRLVRERVGGLPKSLAAVRTAV